VRTPHHDNLTDAAKNGIGEVLRLAESLEGETVTLHADAHVVDEVLAFAQKRNVTRILVGRERGRRISGWFRESVAQQILKKGSRFEITVVSPEDEENKRRTKIGGTVPKFEWSLNDYMMATVTMLMARPYPMAEQDFISPIRL
jgi:two-component system sensor histidine kinase KdpD